MPATKVSQKNQQDAIRIARDSIRRRETIAKRRFVGEQMQYNNTMQQLAEEKKRLQKLCTHPNGKATACLGSHSECADCDLNEVV